MDKKLKETLEKALDRVLQRSLENTYYRLMSKKFLLSIKSKKDFLFGVVVGDMLEGLGFCTFGAYKRYPKESEFIELFKIIHNNSKEIRAKINSLVS